MEESFYQSQYGHQKEDVSREEKEGFSEEKSYEYAPTHHRLDSVNILEVGAGTGSLSRDLKGKVEGKLAEKLSTSPSYLATDIGTSEKFLNDPGLSESGIQTAKGIDTNNLGKHFNPDSVDEIVGANAFGDIENPGHSYGLVRDKESGENRELIEKYKNYQIHAGTVKKISAQNKLNPGSPELLPKRNKATTLSSKELRKKLETEFDPRFLSSAHGVLKPGGKARLYARTRFLYDQVARQAHVRKEDLFPEVKDLARVSKDSTNPYLSPEREDLERAAQNIGFHLTVRPSAPSSNNSEKGTRIDTGKSEGEGFTGNINSFNTEYKFKKRLPEETQSRIKYKIQPKKK